MEVCALDKINKSYSEKIILNNFSLKVYKNDLLCITGKSGSGKSTLLNIVGLLEKYDSGSMTLFGYSNLNINSKLVKMIHREKIGFLFQNYALIENKSVDYNLNIALLGSNKKKEELNLLKESTLNKLGLDVPLNKKIFQLSGGEQQRVAIARLFLKNCELILADEPTGSLDKNNRDEIMEILKKINDEGKTIIIVSHDDYIISSCKRVVDLNV